MRTLLVFFGVVGETVQMQRKSCHSLGEEPDAGIDRGDLHGGFFIHPLTGVSLAEDEGLP